jgi:long-chain acyl-CoA synthetase
MTLLAHAQPATSTSGAPTLVDHLWRQVRERPGLPALHAPGASGWSTTTWGEFGQLTRRIAAFLLSEGLPPHTAVAIWSTNRPEWHIADAAVLSAGLTPTPVYHSLSGVEATYVLNHSESAIAFVDTAATLQRLLDIRGSLRALRHAVVFEPATTADDGFVIGWEEALERGQLADEAWAGRELDSRIAGIAPDDIATLIYTSGTTGPPKAVMLTHANVDAAMRIITTVIPVTPEDRIVSYLPLAHIAERLSSEFRQYIFGNAVHFCPGMAELPDVLREVRPTFFVGVPRVWEKFAHRIETAIDEEPLPRRLVARWAIRQGERAVDRRQADHEVGRALALRLRLADRLVLGKIRAKTGLDAATVMITAAAPIAVETLRLLHGVGLEVSELYGMSEDCGVTSVNPIGRAHLGTVGPPLPGVDVRIADDGEILVRCGAVFAGYFKDEDATHDTIVDGWLHTGDIGHIDDAGYLRITDRKKDLLITAGGKNISPANIEVMLKEHQAIANAVAIGDRRPYVTALMTLDLEGAAELVRHSGLDVAGAELYAHPLVHEAVSRHVDEVNARLAQVEQVKRWQLLSADFTIGEELTPTFKVRRRVVAERYAQVIEDNYK